MDGKVMHNRRLRRDRRTQTSMTCYTRLAADPGRIARNRDVPIGELKMALFEVPENFSGEGTVVLAASTSSSGWNRQYVEVHHAGRVQTVPTPRRKSVLGSTAVVLGAESGTTIEIVLYDAEQWLMGCSDADLDLGDNLAVLGKEVIQFAEAASLGRGRFQLGRMRRGQAGTESAAHPKGEPFALIERNALQRITLPILVPGSPVRAAAQNGSAECSVTLASGLSARPTRRPAPAYPTHKRPAGS
jgi:hypothetical protein